MESSAFSFGSLFFVFVFGVSELFFFFFWGGGGGGLGFRVSGALEPDIGVLGVLGFLGSGSLGFWGWWCFGSFQEGSSQFRQGFWWLELLVKGVEA